MTNLITVPILKCITGWFFIITPEVLALDLSSCFFDDAKRGNINMTMHVNQSKGIVDVLKYFSLMLK